MKKDIESIEKTLQEKLDELAKEKFSEVACFDFFGNLNILEIKLLIKKLENNEISIDSAEAKVFLINYLNKLREELLLK